MKIEDITDLGDEEKQNKNKGSLDYYTDQVLHHEFKDFGKWKKVQKKGKGVIMAIHYSRVIYHNLWYCIFMNLCIFIALFFNYINIIFFSKNADVAFSVVTIVVYLVFIFDFLIYLRGKSVLTYKAINIKVARTIS